MDTGWINGWMHVQVDVRWKVACWMDRQVDGEWMSGYWMVKWKIDGQVKDG